MAQNQPSAFGTLLRQYRMATGLTQEELADRAQISVRTVSDLERGINARPHAHTTRRLADALGLDENERREFLEARLLVRAASGMAREETPADQPALHIVSPLTGLGFAPRSSRDGAGRGVAVLPVGARDAVPSFTIRRVASRAIRADRMRLPGSSGMIGVIVAALVLATGALALLAAFQLAAGKAPSSAVLVGQLDPRWPLPGSALGTLSDPTAVAVDTAGIVYVADTGNDRVDRFSASGRFLSSFGSPGSSPGQFRKPRGIAVDGSGHVYVSDTGNDRIQKFSSSGRWLASWGGRGNRMGQFRSPRGLATDSSGNLYVADRDNNRIQEFARSGVFLHAWGPGISTGFDQHLPPNLHRPVSVALDQADNIYVADQGSTHLHEFSPDAVPLGELGPFGSGLTDPTAIAVEADGTIIVGERSGTPLIEYAAISHARLGRQPRIEGFHVAGITPGRDGAVLVADAAAARVLELDRTGKVIARFGRPPVAPGTLSAPGSLAIDPKGDLYVADTGHRRILQLDPEGRPVAQFAGALGFARGMAVDPGTGTLYVLDSAHDRVLRFSATGELLSSWGGFGDPRGIALDAAGNVYITDDTAGTIQKFTASGAPLGARTIAPPDISNGIGAIAIDRHGTTYVAVTSQSAVLTFSPAGQMIARWTHFHGDIAVVIDRLDNVYVADAGRLQEFSPAGQVLQSVRLPVSARHGPTSTVGIAVNHEFDVLVSDSASNRILKFSPNASG